MAQKPQSRGRGRPSIGDDGSTQFSMRLPNDMLAEIEDVRAKMPGRLNRSDIIRLLLDEALAARTKKTARKK